MARVGVPGYSKKRKQAKREKYRARAEELGAKVSKPPVSSIKPAPEHYAKMGWTGEEYESYVKAGAQGGTPYPKVQAEQERVKTEAAIARIAQPVKEEQRIIEEISKRDGMAGAEAKMGLGIGAAAQQQLGISGAGAVTEEDILTAKAGASGAERDLLRAEEVGALRKGKSEAFEGLFPSGITNTYQRAIVNSAALFGESLRRMGVADKNVHGIMDTAAEFAYQSPQWIAKGFDLIKSLFKSKGESMSQTLTESAFSSGMTALDNEIKAVALGIKKPRDVLKTIERVQGYVNDMDAYLHGINKEYPVFRNDNGVAIREQIIAMQSDLDTMTAQLLAAQVAYEQSQQQQMITNYLANY